MFELALMALSKVSIGEGVSIALLVIILLRLRKR
jgi:hypothetical protein